MSYTPENQNIRDPGWKIIEGIREFYDSVQARIVAGDWSEDHLETITQLAADLTIISNRIAKELR